MKRFKFDACTIIDKPNHYYTKYDGYVGFMCPKCFSVNYFEADFTVSGQKSTFNRKGIDYYMFPTFHIKCSRCNEKFITQAWLDPNIAFVIGLLNKKGYETKYCCEGHREDEIFLCDTSRNKKIKTAPYIMFRKEATIDFIKATVLLPSPWFIKGNSVRCKPKDADKDGNYLEILLNWVVKLPVYKI